MLLLQTAFTQLQAQQQYASSSYNPAIGGASNGTMEKPWTSIDEVNIHAMSGHTIFFKRGDVFFGTLAPQYDNIQFDAYGTGSNPIITGFISIPAANFTDHDNNIYLYPLTVTPTVINMNNSLLEMGRTPNRGSANGGYYTYYTPGSNTNGNYIVKNQENDYVYDAKKVVIKTKPFSIETKAIKEFDEVNSLIYYHASEGFNGANYSFAPTDKFGYYFMDGYSTLDVDGEWYYDEREPNDNSDNTLCVYFSEDPAGFSTPLTLKVAVLDILCNLGQHSNIKIRNIDFDGANRMGIDMGDNSDVVANKIILILQCNFSNMGVRAIHARHTAELYVYGCSFHNCLSGGIQFYTHFYSGWQPVNKIINNQFTNIAPYPGMAYNTDAGDNNAIHAFTAYGSDISENRFDSIGKAAINWQGSEINITRNKISNALLYFCDFGAIYTWEGGTNMPFTQRNIGSNLLYNCPGDISGTQLNVPIANGIYLDGTTSNVTVSHNTIFDMGSSGIMSNNPRNIIIEDNVLYNNVNGIRYAHLADWLPNHNIDITIKDNRIYSPRGQVNTSLLSSNNIFCAAISFEGTMSNWATDLQNTHCSGNAYGLANPRPFWVNVPANANPPDRWLSLAQWAALADEQQTKTFPARENFMPNGQAYKIAEGAVALPYYTPDPTYPNWVPNTSTTATTTVSNAEMKIEFTPEVNVWASVTRTFGNITKTLQPGKKYIISYEVKADNGTRGICRSYVRISGGLAQPTAENYRTYTDAISTVNFLLYVPGSMANPVFCIDILRSSGTTYISNISINEYTGADIRIDEATDFVALAYNPHWWQPDTYNWPIDFPNNWGAEDGFGATYYDYVPFNGYFQSLVVFCDKLINSRPFRVKPPLLPAISTENNITVYPNPATDILNISGLQHTDNWQHIDIVSADGKTVLKKNIQGNANTTVSIGIHLLPRGAYIALLKGKNKQPLPIQFIKY